MEPAQADCLYRSIDAGEPVAVHGDLDTVMAGLACGEVSLIAFDVLLHDSDDVLVITDDAAIACMRLLADGVDGDKPLVCGESGVTGLAAAALAWAFAWATAAFAAALVGTSGTGNLTSSASCWLSPDEASSSLEEEPPLEELGGFYVGFPDTCVGSPTQTALG